jgi:glycosyltransferase involved in cell wall biosynthesis
MANLTVALATYNEEANLRACLESVKDIASEIIIVDGSSTDKTVEIAKEFKAIVKVTDNPPIFHINKQKAIDLSTNEWILQLDADEQVSPKLAEEIKKVIDMSDEELNNYQETLSKRELFLRHQQILVKRDGSIGNDAGPYVAFFIPRLNYFLGRYLRYGGVYPDGVIRLIKKGRAFLPCVDVHEQFNVNGRVGWLENDLLHMADPTFSRYIKRNNRYVSLIAQELKDKNTGKDPLTRFKYLVVMPLNWFIKTYIRHKGFKDSWQGFVFSFISSLRFPRAYRNYLQNLK